MKRHIENPVVLSPENAIPAVCSPLELLIRIRMSRRKARLSSASESLMARSTARLLLGGR